MTASSQLELAISPALGCDPTALGRDPASRGLDLQFMHISLSVADFLAVVNSDKFFMLAKLNDGCELEPETMTMVVTRLFIK